MENRDDESSSLQRSERKVPENLEIERMEPFLPDSEET
jgi:hypothetical protein